jgi:hypothetical protein
MIYAHIAISRKLIPNTMISAIIPAKQAIRMAMANNLISTLPVPPKKVPK